MSRDMSTSSLRVSLGQATHAGRKAHNQDFHGALIPDGRALRLKGVALALADGISTSELSHVAAETAVKALLTDYYATPDAWTVKTAASRVIAATNAWLHAQTSLAGIGEADRGHVCTLAAVIVKARTAHLFHVGDSRIWRVSGGTLEPLTTDHSVTLGGQTMLTRGMGVEHGVDIDYSSVPLAPGDVLLLTTDGVHGFWSPREVAAKIAASDDLDATAAQVIEAALAAGSDDNLTVQILRIEALPAPDATGFEEEVARLAIPPLPRDGDLIDGYRILRPLHGNHRSHIFLAAAPDGQKVVLKIPASDIAQDPAALRRFLMEEWVARRVSSPHLLGAPPELPERSALYTVFDYVPGTSLRQWMHDHPNPSLDAVRGILDQVIRGLRALHRREMLHQDLRPENIMIDPHGTVKIIDFGATHVAGVLEAAPGLDEGILGTLQYTAPEYFSGERVSWSAELFSLGVIAYEMLTGRLPYGTEVSKVTSPRDRARLTYRPAHGGGAGLPEWVDEALRRATHPDPTRRHEAMSEFIADLQRPSVSFQRRTRRPLVERNPLRFWQLTTVFFALTTLALAALLHLQ